MNDDGDFETPQEKNKWRRKQIEKATKRVSVRAAERNKYFGLRSSVAFLADRHAPSYIIDGVMQRGFVYSVTGATGHGKTTTIIEMARAVSTGTFFGVAECLDEGTVVILAGENPDNVRNQFLANCLAKGVDPAKVKVLWHPGRFDIDGNITELLNDLADIDDLKLVVIDTAQAFFAGDNENDNNQMVKFAQSFRPITEIDSRPSVLILAHPSGKKAEKDNLIPRGGGGFLAEIDGNFTIWKNEENEITFHTQGKHRGPYFEPINLVLEEKSFPEISDAHGRTIPVGVVRVQVAQERMDKARERDRLTIAVLEAAEAEGPTSANNLADIAARQAGVSRSTAIREIRSLKKKKMITEANNINAVGRDELSLLRRDT